MANTEREGINGISSHGEEVGGGIWAQGGGDKEKPERENQGPNDMEEAGKQGIQTKER